MKKQILVVEDRPGCAFRAAYHAHSNGFRVCYAPDLETAMGVLDEGNIDAMLTDIGFQEEGVNYQRTSALPSKDKKEELSDILVAKEMHYAIEGINEEQQQGQELKEVIVPSFMEAIDKSEFDPEYGIYKGHTRIELVQELLEKALEQDDVIALLYNADDDQSKDEAVSFIRERLAPESTQNRALGYYVVLEAKKQGIPYAVVTDARHGSAYIPLIAAAGAASGDKLVEAYHQMSDEVRYTHGILQHPITVKNCPVVFSTPTKSIQDWQAGINAIGELK